MAALPPPGPWLWLSNAGAVSCGNSQCVTRGHGHPWAVLGAAELAELGALAKARRLVVRCRCGALQYDPLSGMVFERDFTEAERDIA